MQSVRPPALFWHALARNTNIYIKKKKESLTLFAARKEKKKKDASCIFGRFRRLCQTFPRETLFFALRGCWCVRRGGGGGGGLQWFSGGGL